MSSTGQIVGAIGGAVVGFFMGGPMGAVQGAVYGSALGGWIDPPPGPNLKGPTLNDKTYQSSAYGVSLPALYGTIATMGNIIYLEHNEYKAVSKKEKQGGKGGGGGGTYETTTYYATFAVALGEVMPGSLVRRIWAGGKLIYSAGSGSFDTTLESIFSSQGWQYYDGTQTQPDSRMEAVVGVGRCPSYEGTAYIMLYDFDLTDYGNGLAGCPIKVEIVSNAETSTDDNGKLLGYVDASNVPVVDVSSWGSNCPIRASGRSVVSTLAWSTGGGRDASNIAYAEDFSRSGRSGNTNSITPGNAAFVAQRRVIAGESNVNPCWIHFGDLGDNTINVDHYELWSPSGRYYYPGYLFTSVHEHSDTGLYFRARTQQSSDPVVISAAGPILGLDSGASTVAVGGGVVAVIYPEKIEVYSPGLSLLRTVRNDFGVLTSYRYTIFRNTSGVYLLYVIANDTVNFGYIDYRIISLDDGSSTLHRITLGRNFYMVSGAGFPALSHSEGIFAYGNIFSGQPGVANPYTFVYFALPARYGGVGSISGESALLTDIVAKNFSYCGLSESDYDLSALIGIGVPGYRVDGPGSGRGAISQLQAAYLFDIIEDGYQLKAVLRGGESALSVKHENLMINNGVAVSSSIDGESQLPARYAISHLDVNREYDTNTQIANYPAVGNSERSEQLAIVLTADYAASLADKLINLAHVESKSFNFSLPQSYLGVKPSDGLSVEVYPGYVMDVRVDACSYALDQTITIEARRAEQAVYQSEATGSVVPPPSEEIPFRSASVAHLLDIPMILNEYNYPGVVCAMYGEGTWPGGVLFISSDSGQTFNPVQSVYGKTTIGAAQNVLPADSGAVIDRVSVLNLKVIAGEFYAITEQQMMTGKNYAAYGAQGRWEIVQFSDVVVTGDDTVAISNLVRGMRGTEWATGMHSAGDRFILLDDPDNVFVGFDISNLMVSRQYKAVTIGTNVQDAQEAFFTYTGVNLKPLSPMNCRGEIIDEDWHVSFVGRTRYQGSYWYSGVQPANEPVTNYVIEILSAGSVVRLISSSVTEFVYTAAMQIEDFGAPVESLNLRIFQTSQAVGRGYPLEVTL